MSEIERNTASDQQEGVAVAAAPAAAPTSVASANTKVVPLDAPFKRGEKMVEEVVVRRPNVHALRGNSLTELMQLDVNAIQKVLPRCTEPPLIKSEMDALDPADLLQLGVAVVNFLLPKNMREDLPTA